MNHVGVPPAGQEPELAPDARQTAVPVTQRTQGSFRAASGLPGEDRA